MGTQKNFFEICRHFGHMPSERFTSSVLDYMGFTSQKEVVSIVTGMRMWSLSWIIGNSPNENSVLEISWQK